MKFTLITIPIIVTAISAFFARQVDIPPMSFLTNVLGVVIGAILLFGIKKLKQKNSRIDVALPLIALVALLASFVFPGSEGVHRWIKLGPLNLNASMAMAPLLIYGFSRALATHAWRASLLSLVVVGIHVLQPDAGQLTAIAVSFLVLLFVHSGFKNLAGILNVLILLAGTVLAWMRPDPLAPVPQVEGILQILSSQGTAGYIGLVVALVLLFLPLLWTTRSTSNKALSCAMMAYLAAQFLVTQFGNFPVPVLGAGAGPVIGYCLLLGLILQKEARVAQH